MGLLTLAPPYFACLRQSGGSWGLCGGIFRRGAAGVSKLLGMWRELLPYVTQACTSVHGADGKMKHSSFENVETELS